MPKTNEDRKRELLAETIELYDQIVEMGYSPKSALALATSVLTNERLEVMAIELDRIREAIGMGMALSAIDKIRMMRIKLDDDDDDKKETTQQ